MSISKQNVRHFNVSVHHYGRRRRVSTGVCCGLDYCQGQNLIANCSSRGDDQLVLMQTARYGRMKLGACGTGGSTNVAGCSENVLWYLDRRCSGRPQCKVYVADPVLHHLNPCDSDYSAYLLAKYTCVSGRY